MYGEQISSDSRITRRRLLGLALPGLWSVAAAAACATDRARGEISLGEKISQGLDREAAALGHLSARPVEVRETSPKGLRKLGLDGGRDGVLYVPRGYRVDRPAPLALMLHGAGGNAQHGLSLLQRFADESGLLLVAPDSRRQTWDVIADRYGADVNYIERALAQTFSRYAVDRKRIAVGGFSDGASYALSLGVANGDLFTHVIAFSPGFMSPTRQQGSPRVFISHGTRDQVLPIQRCSRRIVPQLEGAGYDVLYREFDGGHTIPAEIASEAHEWFVK
jgi:phospholipase/carboxylesterase